MRHAAVGMHRALRRTCRAGGVNEDGEIARAAACDHLLPQRLAPHPMIAAERHEFSQRHHHRIGKAAQALHVEHDDFLQCRAARAAGKNLVELLLVLGEDQFGAGVVDEIFHLACGIGRIDAGRDAAGAQNADIGEHPFRHRVGHDRGDVAGRKADRMQAVGDFLRNLQPLPPAGRLPDTEFLFADRRPLAAPLSREHKALRDRVGDRQHCRSGHAQSLPRLDRSGCRLCQPVFFRSSPLFNAKSS
jgi:hypothetical protein